MMMLLAAVLFWQLAGRSSSFQVTSNDLPLYGDIPLCKNQYGEYCDDLSPAKCYQETGRELCCQTCAHHKRKHDYIPAAFKCTYGDRYAACSKIKNYLCYEPYNEHVCCSSCFNKRTGIKGCEYGDREPRFCSKIKPYHCYLRSTEEKCCYTCSMYNTGKPGCIYGDRNLFFEKNRRKYNCEAYIGHFGKWRCAYPWDRQFRYSCCQTCGNFL